MIYKNEIGFSNVRIPNEGANLLYSYSNYNTFPEEVFVHEFLHNLERIENEYGYDVPELHAYEEYGYIESNTEGLKKWYTDYLNCNIKNMSIGLSPSVYTIKPIHDSCFVNSIDLTEEAFDEPENIVEDIKYLLEKVKKYLNTEIEGNWNESIRV